MFEEIREYWDFDDDTEEYVAEFRNMDISFGNQRVSVSDIAMYYNESNDIFEIILTRNGQTVMKFYGEEVRKSNISKKSVLIEFSQGELYLS